jgi:3-oxoacyl-[acyl-carrier-protein] synthase II
MSSPRSVVVTGLGAVSPLGLDLPSYRDALYAGRTGTRRLDFDWLDEEEFRTLVGAPVEGFDLKDQGFTARDLRLLDPACQYAIAATQEALRSAGFELERRPGKAVAYRLPGVDTRRFATMIGSGVGGLTSFETVHRQWVREKTFKGKGFMKYGLPMLIPNGPAANVSITFGLQGECSSSPTACAAGTMAIGTAFRLIRDGEADAAVAGGAECVLSDLDGLGMIGFDVLRVMSARNDDGPGASRPFDVGRDGFVLGDGAGVLVLEAREHAEARGATILAELVSYAATADAHSMMQPRPDGSMVERAMRLGLERAGLEPARIQYVNCHGTSTEAGDPVEAAAIRRVFGEGADAPWVSATKSMTGHCIGASGGLEAIATVLAVREGRMHQTQNLETVDEGCELRHVLGAPQEAEIEHALSAGYGFGGHDAVLVFGKES